MFSKNTLIENVVSLSLPKGAYVVVGGGALTGRGLRETSDIDVVCTKKLFSNLQKAGWEQGVRSSDGAPTLKKGDVEMFLDINVGDVRPSAEELISRAEIIDGVSFASLADTRAFKQAYGREKDLRDIALIDAYVKEMAS